MSEPETTELLRLWRIYRKACRCTSGNGHAEMRGIAAVVDAIRTRYTLPGIEVLDFSPIDGREIPDDAMVEVVFGFPDKYNQGERGRGLGTVGELRVTLEAMQQDVGRMNKLQSMVIEDTSDVPVDGVVQQSPGNAGLLVMWEKGKSLREHIDDRVARAAEWSGR